MLAAHFAQLLYSISGAAEPRQKWRLFCETGALRLFRKIISMKQAPQARARARQREEFF